jgi:hypothetical protein
LLEFFWFLFFFASVFWRLSHVRKDKYGIFSQITETDHSHSSRWRVLP